jgi:hypothetical protein
MYEINLDFRTGKGIINPDDLDDLETSKAFITEIKHESVRKFNKEAKDMLINRLYVLFILIGIIGIMVAVFFIQLPYKYMAIAFGIFLIPIYPLHVCFKNRKKDRAIKKFVSSVHNTTSGDIEAMTNSRVKVVKNFLGQKNFNEFKGFTVYLADHVVKELEKQKEKEKKKLKKMEYQIRKEKRSSMINFVKAIENRAKQNEKITRSKSVLPRNMVNKLENTKNISFINAQQAKRPISIRSIEEEPHVASNKNLLSLPKKLRIQTNSEDSGSFENIPQTEANSKNTSKMHSKDIGIQDRRERGRETNVELKALVGNQMDERQLKQDIVCKVDS